MEPETESERVDRFKEGSQQLFFLFQALILLFKVVSFQGVVVGDHALWQQSQEAVACQAYGSFLLVDCQDILTVVPVKGTGAIHLPLVHPVRIEVVQQEFGADIV